MERLVRLEMAGTVDQDRPPRDGRGHDRAIFELTVVLALLAFAGGFVVDGVGGGGEALRLRDDRPAGR